MLHVRPNFEAGTSETSVAFAKINFNCYLIFNKMLLIIDTTSSKTVKQTYESIFIFKKYAFVLFNYFCEVNMRYRYHLLTFP